MADIPRQYLVHSIDVETYTGTGAYGDQHEAAVPVACMVEDSRRLVRNTDGDEVMSETTLYAHLDDAAKLTEKSFVTLPSGRASKIILRKLRDDGGMGTPQHVEAACE